MNKILLYVLSVVRFGFACSGSFAHVFHNYQEWSRIIGQIYPVLLVTAVPIITAIIYSLVQTGLFKTGPGFKEVFVPLVSIFTALIAIFPYFLSGIGEDLRIISLAEVNTFKVVTSSFTCAGIVLLDFSTNYLLKLRRTR